MQSTNDLIQLILNKHILILTKVYLIILITNSVKHCLIYQIVFLFFKIQIVPNV